MASLTIEVQSQALGDHSLEAGDTSHYLMGTKPEKDRADLKFALTEAVRIVSLAYDLNMKLVEEE